MISASKPPATLTSSRGRMSKCKHQIHRCIQITPLRIPNDQVFHYLSDSNAHQTITQSLNMQSAITAQPARVSNYDLESERFQDSDRPILQNVMASISASGKAYSTLSREAIGRLLDAYHTPGLCNIWSSIVSEAKLNLFAGSSTLSLQTEMLSWNSSTRST